MKKTWKNALCAALSGAMLLSSVPLAGAAYEEYLPTITRMEQQGGEAYYYYTVPFEADTYQYGFQYSSDDTGVGVWYSENYVGIGEEQYDTIFCSEKWSQAVFQS